ncbi:MAG TPA: wax ester/triacylglycerol synthase family O-acyltransferase [Solirubrobacteraceae bacterium]|nr:wax ester/triacylglycerol synthase family O-acyltransferase [Solirubrobacteraceae bacterium]
MADDRPSEETGTPRPARPAPQQLSATDASFLLQERESAHMHIGGVAVFEGPAPDHDEVLAHIERRLSMVPRFRQKLAQPPLGLTRPWWIDDPDFNLDYHLRRSSLPRPGGQRQLQTLVGRLFSQRLDRERPLWEMYLVEGLEDGRFALITKAHHALVDGISGVDLASVILDVQPEPADMPVQPWLRHPGPPRAELLAREVSGLLRTPLALAQEAGSQVLYPSRFRHRWRTLTRTAESLGSQLLDPAPALPLNGPIGPHRRFAARHLSLDEVKAIKNRENATINDVVLTVVTGALRHWLESRGVETEGLEVRALVPVNRRTETERGLLGNRIALLRASLPVYEDSPTLRLRTVRDRMNELKRSRQLAAADTIIGLSSFAPPTILAQASRLNFSTRLFNLIVTNVPGPQLPIYLLGRELESMAPVAFLPTDHALSIAIFSYNGTITFGLLGDYERMGDIDDLADALQQALQELASAEESPKVARPHGPRAAKTVVP